MHLKLMLSLTLAGLAVLFVIQNVTVVQVRFLFWSLSMTLSLFIFLLFATGLIVGWLLQGYWSYRRKSAGVATTMNEAGASTRAGRQVSTAASSPHSNLWTPTSDQKK